MHQARSVLKNVIFICPEVVKLLLTFISNPINFLFDSGKVLKIAQVNLTQHYFFQINYTICSLFRIITLCFSFSSFLFFIHSVSSSFYSFLSHSHPSRATPLFYYSIRSLFLYSFSSLATLYSLFTSLLFLLFLSFNLSLLFPYFPTLLSLRSLYLAFFLSRLYVFQSLLVIFTNFYHHSLSMLFSRTFHSFIFLCFSLFLFDIKCPRGAFLLVICFILLCLFY